jgi:sensor histidine kinase regulating citrate/malate metabolism
MLGILLALNILTLYLFKTICIISKNEQELHAIEVNYQAYDNIVKYIEKSTRQLNTLKHDTKNFQATMIALIKKQKYEDLLEYLEDCAEELQHISPVQDKLSGNTMIDTIFITEINKINGEAQIEFKVADLSEIKFKINHKDLCSILVNLLDNAIEAVMKIENPERRVLKISAYLYKDYVCFNFNNTFEVLPKQLNERFITSKPNKNLHGFGIKSVKDTVSRNQGLCHFKIQDSLFTVQVMLPIKSDHT